MVGELGSDGTKVYWLLLIMALSLPLAIWLSLVLAGLGVSVWSLPPVSVGSFRSPGRPMVLVVVEFLVEFLTVRSSEGHT